jgi:UDP-glucose:tetrahydrobiopterin glucosyltransferase
VPSLGAVRTSRVLLVSTPLGTLGSGRGGGVELTIVNGARALAGRGHAVTILAPEGSVLPVGLSSPASGRGRRVRVVEASGSPPPSAQHQARDAPIVMPPDGVLAAMWARAHQQQADHDLIVNFAFDWLPFYLTPFFRTPVAHLVSMSSLSDAVDGVAAGLARERPGCLAVHSRAQAATFPFADELVVIGNGLDLDRYVFSAAAGGAEAPAPLGWVGRIAAEKGLEDALAAAERAGLPLHVWGVVEDADHWASLAARYPSTLVARGFRPTDELQAELGRCRALLMTPKWVEAYGNVVAEALACGVPVVTYRRGGPAELVEDGVSGFVVPPDSAPALADAVARVGELDRRACRRRAEAVCSLDAFATRLEAWLAPLLAD